MMRLTGSERPFVASRNELLHQTARRVAGPSLAQETILFELRQMRARLERLSLARTQLERRDYLGDLKTDLQEFRSIMLLALQWLSTTAPELPVEKRGLLSVTSRCSKLALLSVRRGLEINFRAQTIGKELREIEEQIGGLDCEPLTVLNGRVLAHNRFPKKRLP